MCVKVGIGEGKKRGEMGDYLAVDKSAGEASHEFLGLLMRTWVTCYVISWSSKLGVLGLVKRVKGFGGEEFAGD